MKAYKGFNRDMTCKGYQYEEGKTYTHGGEIKLCKSGFHACENPLDCFGYYAPRQAIYHVVELDGVSDERESGDSKVVAEKITIGAELSVLDICKAHFEYVTTKCDKVSGRVAGDNEAVAVGEKASASAGRCGTASAGWSGSASAGWSGSASAGEYGSASAGEYGTASAGEQGIAACRGGRVKGGLGCALCATEVDDNGNNIKAFCKIVDGVKIKADTWYTVKNGKFVEEMK